MDQTIFNPRIPYIGLIYGSQFNPGKLVKIHGLAPGIAYRFNINLQCGRNIVPQDDVAIQISVRLLDGYISLNSLQQGIWGEEQLGTLSPVKRNEKFEITIACNLNQYKVSLNGQHYSEFPQRIHYSRITHLTIDGDVSIYKIIYESSTEVSGNGLASAPIPTPPEDNERDDFEFIGATTNRPIGFSEPPSYEAAIDASNRPPYPTSGPIGMPYPTRGLSAGAPYPTSDTSSGMPYPTSIATTTYRPYPTPVTVCTTSPSTHFSFSNRRAANYCGKKFAISCAVFLAIIIIIIVVAIKGGFGRRGDTYNYSNSYDTQKNSYGNSYGYDQYGSNSYNG